MVERPEREVAGLAAIWEKQGRLEEGEKGRKRRGREGGGGGGRGRGNAPTEGEERVGVREALGSPPLSANLISLRTLVQAHMPFNLPGTLVPFYALFNPRLLLPSVRVVRPVPEFPLASTNLFSARHSLSRLCCFARCRLSRRNIRQGQLPGTYLPWLSPFLASLTLLLDSSE